MEFLHLDYKIPPIYEYLRKKLIENGNFSGFLKTYDTQRLNYPDRNTGKFWDEIFNSKTDLMPMEDWRLRKILSLIDNKKSILNIGVGKGALEKILLKKHSDIDYHGTDITHTTLTSLKRIYGNSRFSYQKLPRVTINSNKYDQILLLEVLEHIKPKDTFAVLSEIFRVLAPKGRLIISVPINEHLERILPNNPNSHMRMYSEEVIRTELRLSGFSIEKYIGPPHFMDNLD